MTAIVDISTGKIIGCKPGTATYRHEEGHLEYNNRNFGIRNSFLMSSSSQITIGLLVLLQFTTAIFIKLWCLVSFLMFLVLYIYEELWCWWYAFIGYKKGFKSFV